MAARKGKAMLTASQPPSGRITRSQAAKNRATSAVVPSEPLPVNTELKQRARSQTKRGAVDENANGNSAILAPRLKRRTVLKDVTNLCRVNPSKNCASATKLQLRSSLNVGWSPSKNEQCAKKVPKPLVLAAGGTSFVHDSKRASKTQKAELLAQKKNPVIELNRGTSCHEAIIEAQHVRHQSKSASSKPGDSAGSDIVDIDKDNSNPKMCVSYVAEIYTNLMASEVSDEFKLVPDTLYLTVILIDQYLSQKSIHRKKLQLLGVTSMFIASKYEEMGAPTVEGFCNMTDNAYRKHEVLEMECQVLNVLGFHLSIPTPKKFARRFLRAAQATSNACNTTLVHLANYLVELTLIDYDVLKFLPSMVSASAVFLARWTLNQFDHPWNSTLEHYTSYKSSDLQMCVCVLYGSFNITLVIATSRPHVKDICIQKYESVANLKSPQPPDSLFN
ncbi:hypothetical protein PR202_ga12371 [Eleusine coracana subsp. coracana]|uniref:B-like cyclin n=1 Tax=Eleusine coracana subsp. coracana TaxID=191504 RepID=A0AAV5CBG9_ELECO|nr:hypothetical protein PR202_ga12371 [Eleusine coracana subsp. coracana]